jgi:putative transposase
MAIPPRTTAEGTFFITTITYNRRRLFQLPSNAELFLETLQHYRAEGAYKLHAFVIMPDHVHLLLTPNAKTISQTMNLIKGGLSRRIASKFPVWQRGFADHLILDRDHLESRRTYIHQNPVRAHITTTAELYPYSSAYLAPLQNPVKGLVPPPNFQPAPTKPLPRQK